MICTRTPPQGYKPHSTRRRRARIRATSAGLELSVIALNFELAGSALIITDSVLEVVEGTWATTRQPGSSDSFRSPFCKRCHGVALEVHFPTGRGGYVNTCT